MARPPKPWYREARKLWYVTIDGELHNLGPDEEEAQRRFHELMARKPEEKPAEAAVPLVADIFDRYLDWCQKNRAERTYDWYKGYIQSFLNHTPNAASLTVTAMKPYHVIEWADSNDGWTNNARRGAMIAVQRPMNWAVKSGYIDRSPIPNLEKPQAEPREDYVTPEEWKLIRDHYESGDQFRKILTFIWETGCRPHEARTLEVWHIQLEQMRCVIPRKKAKGKKHPRVIHLTPEAKSILESLTGTEGIVFRNADGQPWTDHAMACRFTRLIKHVGKRYNAYMLRHGFCQRKLEAGVDHLTVAQLMGHTSGEMVSRVYSHMNQADDHLKKALNAE